MMKKMVLGGLLLSAAAAGFAQESRQDVSASVMTAFTPRVNGTGGNKQDSTTPIGFVGSYRYMLTPRSALEANYSFAQNDNKYVTNFLPTVRIHTRQQEATLGYVYGLNFRNFNPFAEAGVGVMFFSPIRDFGTTNLDTKRTTNLGGLFGAGLAYELSPSFDIRAEYRGFVTRAPNFGLDNLKTNRYYVISMPAIGVAYHF